MIEKYSAENLNKLTKFYSSILDCFNIKNIEAQTKAVAKRGKFELKYPFFSPPFNIEDVKKYFLSKGFKVKVEPVTNDEYYYETLILNWGLIEEKSMEKNLAMELNEVANLYNSTYDYYTIKEIEEQAEDMAEQGNFELKYYFFDKPFNIEDIKNYFLSRGFKVEIKEDEEIDVLILDWSLN